MTELRLVFASGRGALNFLRQFDMEQGHELVANRLGQPHHALRPAFSPFVSVEPTSLAIGWRLIVDPKPRN